MIHLDDNKLEVSFPEIHENAGVVIDFQRTLRVPDDDTNHFLPPGLGRFPLRHIEDYDLKNNNHLKERGGVIMPMFQTDAVWLSFTPFDGAYILTYPIAIKIGTGKICAVSGDEWTSNLNRNPQDYVVTPEQEWIDGYNVDKLGSVRQFIAAPLGQGYTVEEQMRGSSSVGGIQIQAYPLKREKYELLLKAEEYKHGRLVEEHRCASYEPSMEASASLDMGLAPGGLINQKIYEDPYSFDDWDLRSTDRCFVTLANANQWMSITGEEPPISPLSAKEYSEHGLPWFHYFDGDREAIDGAKKLGKVKSVKELSETKGGND